MTETTNTRAVHSIVCVLPEPPPPGRAAGSAEHEGERLARLIARALTHSRSSAEHVIDIEIGSAVAFLNSGAALNFVRVLQHCAAEEGIPVRIGVHMGSLGADDPRLDQRGPLRITRQIAMRASAGEAFASTLFHNFVTQFDHRCKSILRPLSPFIDSEPGSPTLFEIVFDELPPLKLSDEQPDESTAASDVIGLPTESEQRNAFLLEVERALAEEIGPMAGILVRQAAETEKTRAAFFRQIVKILPEGPQRADFFLALDRL